MKPPAKPPLPKSAQLRLQRLLTRLAMLAILALSLALLWWSLAVRLAPVNRQYQEKMRELSALVDQVDKSRLQWPASKLEQLQAEYQVAQSLLFADAAEVADWETTVKNQTAQLGLETTLQLDGPQADPAAGQKLLVLRAALKLQPAKNATVAGPPYARLLDFAQSLDAGNKRIDLLELSVAGNSNSVQQADLVVSLWSSERSSK